MADTFRMFDLTTFLKERRGSFGSAVHFFGDLTSTNAVADRLARDGAAEGTIVIGEEQTSGRGRKGNNWYSPPGANLYFSVIVRPSLSLLPFLPFCAALSIIDALKTIGVDADLKWPNDIVVFGRKLSGVLVESCIEANNLQFAIIGCGVNVNIRSFPVDLQNSATSVFLEKGSSVSREKLLNSILERLEKNYEKIKTVPWTDFVVEIEAHSSFLRNCEVIVRHEKESFRGITDGLDSFGGLILRMNGESKVFYAGEVEQCRKV